MNGKQAKKLRQAYRRDVRAKFAEQIDAMKDLIKPRPRWCPAFVWNALRRLILNV